MTSTPQIRRILLPIDASPGTEAAVGYAVLLARAVGAPIVLVHVDEVPHSIVAIVPGASIAGDLADQQRASTARLADLEADVRGRGFTDVSSLHVTAPAIADAIVATAMDTDLIVMGTHGRTGVSRLVFGSIAEAVLRHAPCPVLTVHLP